MPEIARPEIVGQTVYFPRVGKEPSEPEPVPHVMTEEDVVRFLRLESSQEPYRTLYRYRQQGLLRVTQVGKHVRYLLPDVLRFLENARENNPR